MNIFKNMMLPFLSGIVGAILFTTLHQQMNEKRIASVQMNTILERHLQYVRSLNLSESEQALESERFSQHLKNALYRISKEERVTLIVAPALLSDAPDYTDYIYEYVKGQQ